MTARSITLALCLLTVACGQKADDGNAVATTAEVLPGSISDAMINLDTSTASPPMAPVRADPEKKAAPASGEADEPEEPATVTLPETEQAPAQSPEAE